MAVEDIYLAEFNRCRDEIDNRTDISEKLVLGQITALGAGIAMLDKVPDVLLGLSVVTTFIWLFWLAHTQQISKLAGYIALELAPRLRELSNEWVLGWEEYRMGHSASARSYQPPSRALLKTLTAKASELLNAAVWKLFLFAGATPGLLIPYWLIIRNNHCALLNASEPVYSARLVMIVVSLAIWMSAIIQYFSVRRIWRTIDQDVIDMASQYSKLRSQHYSQRSKRSSDDTASDEERS